MAIVEITSESPKEPTPEELEKVRRQLAQIEEDAERQWRAQYAKHPLSTEPSKIVYCMNFYQERMSQVIRCIERVRPYVDRCVLVYDDTVTEESKKWLEQWGCELYYRKWDNHFSKQRNAYLEHVNEGEWVLVSDPDELFCTELLKDLRRILTEAQKSGINIFGINAHDITTQLDGKVTESVSDWFKQLLFQYEEGVRYVGCVHETLLPGVHGWRVAHLDKRYYYEHIKSMIEVKERGARNVFCGGGGNNVKEKNPMYVELHEVTDSFGIKDWPTLREHLRKPHLNRRLWEKIKEIAIAHRNDCGWDWQNESRDLFIWLKTIHPDELAEWFSIPTEPSKGSPPEVMAYVEEQYLKILGRNADDLGKQEYTRAILEDRIKREHLPEILMNSEEYKQKHSTEMVTAVCQTCGKEFQTLAKNPLKICGDCAFKLGGGEENGQ